MAQNDQFNRRHGARQRSFNSGELVSVQIHHQNSWHWRSAKVIERQGKVMYTVAVERNGRNPTIARVHANQIRLRFAAAANLDHHEDENLLQLMSHLDDLYSPIPIEANPVQPSPQPPIIHRSIDANNWRPIRIRRLPERFGPNGPYQLTDRRLLQHRSEGRVGGSPLEG